MHRRIFVRHRPALTFVERNLALDLHDDSSIPWFNKALDELGSSHFFQVSCEGLLGVGLNC